MKSARDESSDNNESNSYLCKISLQLSSDQSVVKHLKLDKFKTEHCPKSKSCENHQQCFYYHSNADKRRSPAECKYMSTLCEFGMNCLKKTCPYSHNEYEKAYHPNQYRKIYCTNILKQEKCPMGDYCANAHSDSELKVELIHTMERNDDFFLFKYKTELCPIHFDHNYDKCIYGHSWEDFRRDIMKTPYGTTLCRNWEDEGKCPEGQKCDKAHGQNEIEFHPLNYKRLECQYGSNCKRVYCGYLHPGDSTRFLEIAKKDKFYIYPYNRILPGLFVQTQSIFNKKSENIINGNN